MALRKHVVHKGNEVSPLGDRSVLELIDKDMAVPAAQTLEEKRNGIVPNHARHALVQGVKGADVAILLNLFHLVGNQGKRPDQIDFVEQPFPKQMGRPCRGSCRHVSHLIQHVLCVWGDALDSVDHPLFRFLSGEHRRGKHVFQGGRGRHRRPVSVFFKPRNQGPAGDVLFGQALTVDRIQSHLHARSHSRSSFGHRCGSSATTP